MDGDNPKATATVGGHPLHALLIPFPIVCFIGAFVTDLVGLNSSEPLWLTASRWLLGAGLVGGIAACATGFADYLGDTRIRRIGAASRHMIANLVVMGIEALNLVLRLLEPGPNVGAVPVWLGAAGVAILAYSGWLGGDLVYRHRVGVRDSAPADPPPSRTKFSRDRR